MSYMAVNDAKQLQFCGELLGGFVRAMRPPCDVLLFVLEYGEGGSISACATYPERSRTLEAIRVRLERWEAGTPSILHDPAVHGWVPTKDELDVWHEWMTQRIKASGKPVGYMLFAGNSAHTQYVASVEREGAIGSLKEFVRGTLRDMA